MRNAADYLLHVKSLIVANPQVAQWTVVREEAQGDSGLFRYKLVLRGGSLLELFERFEVLQGNIQVIKYSFHWQHATGELIRRWDNAPHHPELHTAPHHLHDGFKDEVFPHPPVTAEKMLSMLAAGTAGENNPVLSDE